MSRFSEEIAAVDLGGTHARFAIAAIEDGRVAALGEAIVLRAEAFPSLVEAWAAFAGRVGRPLPRAAAIAVAGPVEGGAIRLTNNAWTLDPATLPGRLGLDHLTLVNDFGAVAHAVAQLPAADFAHICGPDVALPRSGVISVVGPGTGLGVAQLVRDAGGCTVVETEGGHVGFAPADPFEDALLARLRAQHGRVSAERIVAGSGLAAIYATLAAIDGVDAAPPDDPAALWTAALGGTDALAFAALERFCLGLGGVAGDIALAQGARGVAIGGGLGLRLAALLPRSGFADRFAAKGRFAAHMRAMPVRLITHPQPGLYGAAAAGAAALARDASGS